MLRLIRGWWCVSGWRRSRARYWGGDEPAGAAGNGGSSFRGLIEEGARSLEPLVSRLGGAAEYQSMPQFFADGPWGPAPVVRAVRTGGGGDRVGGWGGGWRWVSGRTGRIAGCERQYSGTLRKVADCQMGCGCTRSERGDDTIGWACISPRSRRGQGAAAQGEDPEEVRFRDEVRTGVELGAASGWAAPRARCSVIVTGRRSRSGRGSIGRLRVRARGRARRKVFAHGTTVTPRTRAVTWHTHAAGARPSQWAG